MTRSFGDIAIVGGRNKDIAREKAREVIQSHDVVYEKENHAVRGFVFCYAIISPGDVPYYRTVYTWEC